jgi:hypothetical protein
MDKENSVSRPSRGRPPAAGKALWATGLPLFPFWRDYEERARSRPSGDAMKPTACLLVLAAALCAALPASAQTEMVSTSSMLAGFATTVSHSGTRIGPANDPSAARDGCMNVPGVAHSSADCSVMTWMDPNTVLPDKPLDQMSGAEENLIRNYNLLVKNPVKPRSVVSFSRQ